MKAKLPSADENAVMSVADQSFCLHVGQSFFLTLYPVPCFLYYYTVPCTLYIAVMKAFSILKICIVYKRLLVEPGPASTEEEYLLCKFSNTETVVGNTPYTEVLFMRH